MSSDRRVRVGRLACFMGVLALSALGCETGPTGGDGPRMGGTANPAEGPAEDRDASPSTDPAGEAEADVPPEATEPDDTDLESNDRDLGPDDDAEPQGEEATADEAGADEVAAWLTGHFDSSRQALRDPDFLEVSLSVCDVTAPALGERVLYVEQAMMQRPAEPYRQRLYVVEALGGDQAGTVASRIYTFSNEVEAVGLCQAAVSDRQRFVPERPTLRTGCDVMLTKRGEAWVGGTEGRACASTLRGATYATSEVSLEADGVLSWDRGFDANGVQVWGAVDGPYEFLRVQDEEAPEGGGEQEVDDTEPADDAGDESTGSDPNDDAPAEAAGGAAQGRGGETCEDAPSLSDLGEALPEDQRPLTHRFEANFGQTNDYNAMRDAGLAPGCSLVYDALGAEVVFAVDLAPGETLHTQLVMDRPDAAGALYLLDDCAQGTWPDHDDSGMCGRNEYRSHGSCHWGDCEPLDWQFTWPERLAGQPAEPTTVYLVVDEVAGDEAASFTLSWGISEP